MKPLLKLSITSKILIALDDDEVTSEALVDCLKDLNIPVAVPVFLGKINLKNHPFVSCDVLPLGNWNYLIPIQWDPALAATLKVAPEIAESELEAVAMCTAL